MSNIKKMLNTLKSSDAGNVPPYPLWLLNDLLTPATISSRLKEMQEQSVSTFIVRPEKGVIPEYPSKDFLYCLSLILKQAKERKMSVLFSEDMAFGYPGVVTPLTSAHPEFRLPYLSLHHILKIRGPKKIVQEFNETDIQYVFAIRLKERFLDFASAKNITTAFRNNTLTYSIPNGDWRIFIFRCGPNKRSIGGSALNFLDPAAGRAYVQAACTDLVRELPKDLLSAFAGFFLELPLMAPDTSIRGLPWSDTLLSKLKSESGTDLISVILALFVDNYSAKNGLIRRTYYRLLLEMLQANLIRPLREFGSRFRYPMHLFAQTGDLFSGETVLRVNYEPLIAKNELAGVTDVSPFSLENSSSVRLFGDLFRDYSGHQALTILGRNRNAISQSLKDLKQESDRLTLAGLQCVAVDGQYHQKGFSIAPRTPDNPLLPGSLSGFIRSRQAFFGAFQRREEIGVLFPAESFNMAYNPANLTLYKQRTAHFDALVRQLSKDDMPFRFLTEQTLTKLTVSDKGLLLLRSGKSQVAFKVLILPETVILPRKVIPLLEKFVAKGGRLVFFGIMPYETFEGGKNSKLLAGIEKLGMQMPGAIHKFSKIEELETLRQICAKILECSLEVFSETEGARRLTTLSVLDGEDRVHFLSNASLTENLKVELRFNGKGHLHYLDFGKPQPVFLPGAQGTEKGRSLFHNFAPGETGCFIVAADRLGPAGSPLAIEESNRIFRIILKDEWQLTLLDPNAMPLNSWSMRINSNRDINAGYNLSYESYINVVQAPATAYILMNRLINHPVNGYLSGNSPVEISFNGVILKNMHFFNRGEKTFHETDAVKAMTYGGINTFGSNITSLVRKGINRVTIKTYGSTFEPMFLSHPLVFLGDFALKRGSQGWLVSPKNELYTYGSWTDQGLPYFCGRAVYSQVFEKPGNFKRILLRFKNFESSLLVRINGVNIPVSPWQPVVADITKHVTSEKNKLELEISNTPANLFKLMTAPAGLTAEVYMDVY
ncbi:MAG: hypothetical protein A2293_01620 [Elusimicrobia bacterium RIFOXYB2_FULL_49_7]|nr:MAG: hypothetical protein A2293_01620 [Elusimicrobia bacterium RIFOXYB2_FULL_49_7]